MSIEGQRSQRRARIMPRRGSPVTPQADQPAHIYQAPGGSTHGSRNNHELSNLSQLNTSGVEDGDENPDDFGTASASASAVAAIAASDIEEEASEEEEGEDDEEEAEEGEEASSPTASLSPPASPIPASLREISALASWTVSTYKPGCGVPELLSPSLVHFWQSDGPQPHLLTIHFFKVVCIVRIRIYLDQELDESYTPTRMVFAAGMGEHDLVTFGEWRGEEPKGWVEVDLEAVGGRDLASAPTGLEDDGGADSDVDGRNEEGRRGEDDGKVLRCMCVQIRVLENHQNGKDTHVRGVQLFARDERLKKMQTKVSAAVEGGQEGEMVDVEEFQQVSEALMEPEWAREMEIR